MSKCQGAITELLWSFTLEGFCDEQTGSSEELGWYGLFEGPLTADDIDDHNEIVLSNELQKEQGYREHLLKAADIWTAMNAAGFIVEQHSSGAVYSTVYGTEAELKAAWQEIIDRYHVNVCDTCGSEAEEYGLGNPIIHEDGCTVAVEEAA